MLQEQKLQQQTGANENETQAGKVTPKKSIINKMAQPETDLERQIRLNKVFVAPVQIVEEDDSGFAFKKKKQTKSERTYKISFDTFNISWASLEDGILQNILLNFNDIHTIISAGLVCSAFYKQQLTKNALMWLRLLENDFPLVLKNTTLSNEDVCDWKVIKKIYIKNYELRKQIQWENNHISQKKDKQFNKGGAKRFLKSQMEMGNMYADIDSPWAEFCFHGEANILMSDGSFRFAKEINVGDQVMTIIDGVFSGAKIEYITIDKFTENQKFMAPIGGTYLTLGHPVYIENENIWKRAGDIIKPELIHITEVYNFVLSSRSSIFLNENKIQISTLGQFCHGIDDVDEKNSFFGSEAVVCQIIIELLG